MTVYPPRLSEAKAALLEKYLRGEISHVATQRGGIPRRPPDAHTPASFGQQQIWLLTQMAENQPVYNECVTIRMNGPVDARVLEQAFNEVLRRHEAWRTTFALVGGELTEIIHPVSHLSLPVIDLRHLPAERREAEALRLATEDARVIFDLAAGPLLRPRLVVMADTDYRLYMPLHHIIFDVVSIYEVLLPEVAAFYGEFAARKSASLLDPAIQYADFAYWQRQRLDGDFLAAHMAYWRGVLGDLPVLQLPTDHPRPTVQTYRGARQRLALPKALTDALNDFNRREGVTLYMTLVSALITLLHRYSGQEDIVIGTVTGSRDRPELEKLMGFFLNTLALRIDLASNPTFREVLARVRKATLEMQEHREVPFELVVQELHPQRNFTQNPLFQVMFTLEPPLKPIDVPWSVSLLDVDVGTAKFDLSIELDERAEGIIGRFEYSTDLFEHDTIFRMVRHFATLLEGIVKDPGKPISDLPFLTDEERHRLLTAWNRTDASYPCERHIHELFAEQAAHTPDAVAVIFGEDRITYRSLDERANRLAHHLQGYGVGPDVLVGIAVGRSAEMLVALLAVLKAGGAYVPLDPTYPRERLAFMLADAQVRVLLTEQRLLAQMPAHDAMVICLDRDQDVIARHLTTPPPSAATPEDLAYVIYTSGSTGKPKGVMIPRRALMNLLWDVRGRLGVARDDVVLASTSLSFDIAGFEMYLPLLVGARIVIVTHEVAAHGRHLAAAIAESGATVMQATPTTWRMLIEAGWQGSARLHIISTGEALPQALARQLLPAGRRLTNLYGPTETTIWSTIDEIEDAEKPVSLGRPIANTQLFILDRDRHPVPVGVPGELYIGGDGLARGYLHRPELTEQRFVSLPLDTGVSARVYATGDLVRYLPDGTVEYLGRIDHQVKVRGFRIELGEIETLLERHVGVRQAVVVARKDVPENATLAAYIVPAQTPPPTVSEFRQALTAHLPDYMIPSAFVLLDVMPMTPNGKVDRQALPAPGSERPELSAAYVAPTTQTETALVEIYAEVLGLAHVGVHDDFFSLGGHSLLGGQAIARACAVFQIDLPLRALFEHPTVAGLAQAIEDMLLREVEELSEDELERLLESESLRPGKDSDAD